MARRMRKGVTLLLLAGQDPKGCLPASVLGTELGVWGELFHPKEQDSEGRIGFKGYKAVRGWKQT